MKLRYASTPIAVALLALSSLAHAAPSLCDATSHNLVANCGFETGSFSSWSLSGNDVPIAQDNLYGVEGQDIDGTNPHSGTSQAYFGDLVSNATTLSQTLTTAAGASYTISFFLAQDTTPSTEYGNALSVQFGGVSLASLTNIPVEGYTSFSYTGVATSASTLFSLTLGNGIGYFLLDDVSVTAVPRTVPEPSTLALTAMAALSLGLKTRRRQRTSAS